jgi:ribosomal protein S18 acetylase RimI-like enzyme
MNIQLKILNSHDAEKYRALRLYSLTESPYAFSESYEDEQLRSMAEIEHEIALQGNPQEQFVLGAFVVDDLIGCVSFLRDARTKARHKAFLRAMFVHPTYRMRGIAKMLIEEVIAAATKMDGLEYIHLWVLHHGATSASQFYRRIGFVGQGALVRNDLKINGQYVDAEYMILDLR